MSKEREIILGMIEGRESVIRAEYRHVESLMGPIGIQGPMQDVKAAIDRIHSWQKEIVLLKQVLATADFEANS